VFWSTLTASLCRPIRIAQAVGAHQSDFSIAGTKDKAAVTTQRVHVRNVTPKALDKAVNPRSNMRAGNYAYTDRALSLGGTNPVSCGRAGVWAKKPPLFVALVPASPLTPPPHRTRRQSLPRGRPRHPAGSRRAAHGMRCFHRKTSWMTEGLQDNQDLPLGTCGRG
jgi:hypothetical protein